MITMNPPTPSRIQVRPGNPNEGRQDYISIRDFGFWYGDKKALDAISVAIPERQVVAFIGPSGCGKSTLLRNLNRMNDLIDGIRHEGEITINGRSIYDPGLEVISLRRRVGMVFQKSNPFPKSIFENVVYALRVVGVKDRALLEEACETLPAQGRPLG
ncbi:phosphate import ATP-binding protein PstB [Verrucomicrobiota bacterium]|nr:phosphate import ATP-binding protein PstB [Verrucomicrobiota bacterium]